MNLKEMLKNGEEFTAVNKKGEKATLQGLLEAGQVLVTFEGAEEPKAYKWSTVERGQGWKVIESDTTTPETVVTTEDAPTEEASEPVEEVSAPAEEVIEDQSQTEGEDEKMITEKGFAKYGEEIVYIEGINGKMVTIIDKDGVDAPAHIDKLEPIELSEAEKATWEKIINPAAPVEKEEAPKAPRTNNGGGRKVDTVWKVQVADFLTSVLEGIRSADPGFTKVKKVGDRNYIVFGAGKTGLSIVLTINKKAVITEFYGEGEAMETVKGYSIKGYTHKEAAKNVRLYKEVGHDGTTENIMDLVESTIAEIFQLKANIK